MLDEMTVDDSEPSCTATSAKSSVCCSFARNIIELDFERLVSPPLGFSWDHIIVRKEHHCMHEVRG